EFLLKKKKTLILTYFCMFTMGCRCLRKTPGRLPNKAIKHIKNIEIIPISGSCRHTQIIGVEGWRGLLFCTPPPPPPEPMVTPIPTNPTWISKCENH
uniref:Chemokine interleukin-8-like domain-containing protein n=1 Tax=Sphaeramia orbicularis TaxID=375764 RepID=A0A672YIR3_9TELE